MSVIKADIATLHNILKLEVQKGYANMAVVGGINEYLDKWAPEIKNKIRSPQLKKRLNHIILSGGHYKDWDMKQRQEWVETVEDWLRDYEKSLSHIKRNTKTVEQVATVSKAKDSPVKTIIDNDITFLKGVKSSTAAKFKKLGIKTIQDLLYFFPRYHIDYSQKKTISELPFNIYSDAVMGPVTVSANIWESRVVELGARRMRATEVVFGDETGNATAIWYNQPYLARQFNTNSRMIFSGKYKVYKGKIVFQSPEWDIEEQDSIHTGRLVPVYALTSGLYQRQLRNLIRRAVDLYSSSVIEYLPEDIRQRLNLLTLSRAITAAHFPDNNEQCTSARERLAFDELFLLQLGLMRRKRQWQSGQPGIAIDVHLYELDALLSRLPFQLTGSQKLVLQDILKDMNASKPMSRLLQGEVGSGKTIIAVLSLLTAIRNGYQCVFMAPTEILAEQHFSSICNLLENLGAKLHKEDSICVFEDFLPDKFFVSLLTGKTGKKVKSSIYDKVSANEIDLVIGTHAVIQKGLDFNNLNLIVIDEQHRFGVMQRNALRQKGHNPHMLVMTATPIPRTLALTLYSDLDISVINELPPGRQKIITKWIKPEMRQKAYEFIRKQIYSGRQAFIICPLIEESENIEAKAAVEEYEKLSNDVYRDLKIGLLHGKMKPGEKDQVMTDFRDGKYHILVSTPVVEVGIDIPNATVILIEAADRFGLSQLHQFRGRVGRGKYQSYCLLSSENPSEEAVQRISSIESIHDGFKLAEKDLELRGPGDFLGTRQSGLPNLVMAKLTDVRLLEKSRKEAINIFNIDPDLKMSEHKKLVDELNRVWFNIAEWS
jgi:ATP-dependent DNA helicase RecG